MNYQLTHCFFHTSVSCSFFFSLSLLFLNACLFSSFSSQSVPINNHFEEKRTYFKGKKSTFQKTLNFSGNETRNMTT